MRQVVFNHGFRFALKPGRPKPEESGDALPAFFLKSGVNSGHEGPRFGMLAMADLTFFYDDGKCR
jgi:hypothetical protein